MSRKIVNYRITNNKTEKKNMSDWHIISQDAKYYASVIKGYIGIFLLIMAIIDLIVLISVFVHVSNYFSISLTFIGLLLANIIAGSIFKKITLTSLGIRRTLCAILFIFLAIITICNYFIAEIGSHHGTASYQEIKTVEKSSEMLISTECANLYLDPDNKIIYTISDMGKGKYINKYFLSNYNTSEYLFLYNVGIQVPYKSEQVSDFFLYPPTPHTITSYEYLVEVTINGERYIGKAFIPGLVNFKNNASSVLFYIRYSEDSTKYYLVSKIDEYLVFQSDVSTFSTIYKNVKYSEKEYFYVRYNRYLSEIYGINNYEPLDETNVKYINSLQTISPTIQKINFFWVGSIENETFIATTPVVEVVYANGTSDIAIIRDIDAKRIESIIGYS